MFNNLLRREKLKLNGDRHHARPASTSGSMTILDIPLLDQNLIKSTILLATVIIDWLINPRSGQTSEPGDI